MFIAVRFKFLVVTTRDNGRIWNGTSCIEAPRPKVTRSLPRTTSSSTSASAPPRNVPPPPPRLKPRSKRPRIAPSPTAFVQQGRRPPPPPGRPLLRVNVGSAPPLSDRNVPAPTPTRTPSFSQSQHVSSKRGSSLSQPTSYMNGSRKLPDQPSSSQPPLSSLSKSVNMSDPGFSSSPLRPPLSIQGASRSSNVRPPLHTSRQDILIRKQSRIAPSATALPQNGKRPPPPPPGPVIRTNTPRALPLRRRNIVAPSPTRPTSSSGFQYVSSRRGCLLSQSTSSTNASNTLPAQPSSSQPAPVSAARLPKRVVSFPASVPAPMQPQPISKSQNAAQVARAVSTSAPHADAPLQSQFVPQASSSNIPPQVSAVVAPENSNLSPGSDERAVSTVPIKCSSTLETPVGSIYIFF